MTWFHHSNRILGSTIIGSGIHATNSLWAHNSNLVKTHFDLSFIIMIASSSSSNGPMWLQIFTCHDTQSAVTCTKLWPNYIMNSLQWRHNERGCVSNQQRLHCLLSCRFRPRAKKTSKLRVTGLCAGNSPVTGEFPAQKASNVENVSIWWRHYVNAQQHVFLQRLRLWAGETFVK